MKGGFRELWVFCLDLKIGKSRSQAGPELAMSDLRGPDHCENRLESALYATLALLLLSLSLLYHMDFYGSTLLLSLVSLFLAVAAFLLWDIKRMQPSRTLTVLLAIKLYLRTYTVYKVVRNFMKKEFEPISTNVVTQQSNFLLDLMQKFEGTEYGKEYGFHTVKSVRDFQNQHPLVDYEHYRPYITRVLELGQKNVIYPDDVIYAAMTSGTTGENKLLPMNKSAAKNFTHFLLWNGDAVIGKPWRDCRLKKSFELTLHVPFRQTQLGVRYGPVSYLAKIVLPAVDLDAVPIECWDIVDDKANIYVQCLFALYNRDTEVFAAAFPSVYALFLSCLERDLDSLCCDIERGEISHDINLDQDIRRKLNRKLLPWPERAEEIRDVCSHGYEGVTKKLWPDLKLVVMPQDGHFQALAASLLQRQFLGIANQTFCHGATEGNYGFPIPPGTYGNDQDSTSVFALNVTQGFFEFIPHSDPDPIAENDQRIESDEGQDEDGHDVTRSRAEQGAPLGAPPGASPQGAPTPHVQTRLVHELQPGHSYELVITGDRCLYRYKTEDVIRIVGFYNQIPLYRFVQRRGDLLNIACERMPQIIVNKTILQFSQQIGLRIIDYTTVESNVLCDAVPKQTVISNTVPGYYVIMAEMDGDTPNDASSVIDRIFGENFENYKAFRRRGQIGEARILILKRGTFDNLAAVLKKENNASINQMKYPKVMRKPQLLQFMIENVVK